MSEAPVHGAASLLADAGAYGDRYQDHLMQQYLMFVEMTDRVSARRRHANTYFISGLSLLAVLYALVKQIEPAELGLLWRYGVPAIGVLLCIVWWALLRSYSGLNKAKFKVIHELERRLPARVYEIEWRHLGEGRRPLEYLPLGQAEQVVPWLFLLLFLGLCGLALLASWG